MKFLQLFVQVFFIYILYLIGSWIQEQFNLFIPGSIIGMLLLFILLTTNMIKSKWMDQGAELLIRYFPLLFLPIIVGIINYFDVFSGKGLLLLVIVCISTIIVMITSGFIAELLWRRMERSQS